MGQESIHALGPTGDKRWLLIVASQIETNAIAQGLGASPPSRQWQLQRCTDRFDIIMSGVGKANAAGATALAVNPERHCGVVSLGIGGALLDELGLPCVPVLSTVAGTACLFADEGIERDTGWSSIASLGFPPCAGLDDEPELGISCTPELIERMTHVVDQQGVIATVSTCSGTDAAAHATRARTGGVVEAMEGAAVGLAARRTWKEREGDGPAPFIELRAVSNATGSTGEAWQLKEALARLGQLVQVL